MAYQNARRPCIAKRISSVKKVMYAIFFTPNVLALQVSIPKGKSMNTRYKVLQVQSSKKICQILPEMLTEDRHLWYLFVT